MSNRCASKSRRGAVADHELAGLAPRLVAHGIGTGIDRDASDHRRPGRGLLWIGVQRSLVQRTRDVEAEVGVAHEEPGLDVLRQRDADIAVDADAFRRIVVAEAVAAARVELEERIDIVLLAADLPAGVDLSEAAAAHADLGARLARTGRRHEIDRAAQHAWRRGDWPCSRDTLRSIRPVADWRSR